MDSDLQHQQYHHHFQPLERQQQRDTGGGLTRYRSAPSSFFDTAAEADFSQPRPLSPETESILARFVQSVADGGASASASASASSLLPVKQETPTTIYHPSSNKPPLPFASRIGGPSQFHAKREIGNSASLARHRSSPAGLFDHIIVENGLLVSNQNPKRRKEVEESIKFPAGNWDDLSEQFGGCENQQQSEVEGGGGRSSGVGVGRMSVLGLGHHMSLPTAASLDKLMQIDEEEDEEDRKTLVVGCQLRAKRGCATHPRSIAERVRRTKISERMRKLQDLVPNMDNQTNTADMLDLAVDYIKHLQAQISTLGNKRARCTCSISRS